MMPHRYTAKKPFDCALECGSPGLVGQPITWARTGDKQGLWCHVDCAHPYGPNVPHSTPDSPKPVHSPNPCPDCGMIGDNPEDHLSDCPQYAESAQGEQSQPPLDPPPHPDNVTPTGEHNVTGVQTPDPKIEELEKKVEAMQDAIDKLCGPTPKKTGKLEHKDYQRLLNMLRAKSKIFLHGAVPGCGKSHCTFDAATELGLEYASLSLTKTTPDHRLMGFKNAIGEYQDTPFSRWAEYGGLFTIEEICNGSGPIFTSLCSMLEHGYIAFPHKVIQVDFDKSLLIIVDNTDGRGGNELFPDREALDTAFITRFDFLEWSLDEKLEKGICQTIDDSPTAREWLKWVRSIRKFAKDAYPQLMVSPRTAFSGTRLLHHETDLDKLAHATLWKGTHKTTIESIMVACPYPEKLANAFGGGLVPTVKPTQPTVKPTGAFRYFINPQSLTIAYWAVPNDGGQIYFYRKSNGEQVKAQNSLEMMLRLSNKYQEVEVPPDA